MQIEEIEAAIDRAVNWTITTLILLVLVGLVILLAFVPASAEVPDVYAPDHVIVKFKTEGQTLRGGKRLAKFASGAELYETTGESVESVIERLMANPAVLYAEPDYYVYTDPICTCTVNDPLLPDAGMYGLRKIQAPQAWNTTHGVPSVVVAVIDTGVDLDHPDLAANIWTNPGEIPGDGVDNDANGYIDDIHGYDFIDRDSDPTDLNGHGTHTAGTVAAVGDNGIGVVGVAWGVRIMALRFLSGCGAGLTSDAILAIDYARRMGATLSSNSWGSSAASQALKDAIAASPALFIASAGNSFANADAFPSYPAAYDLPQIVSVASSDSGDFRSSFSNWGLLSVDLAAPGSLVLSTYQTLGCNGISAPYRTLSGTSMAAPHVAGAAALLLSYNPALTTAQVKSYLMQSVDPLASFATTGTTPVASGGRLNALSALRAAGAP